MEFRSGTATATFVPSHAIRRWKRWNRYRHSATNALGRTARPRLRAACNQTVIKLPFPRRDTINLAAPPLSHHEAALQHDIDLIRSKVLEMLALDEQALTRAFQAFAKRDRQLAYSVILRDQDVDALDAALDRMCLEFIVRHQPAASLFRFVDSGSKIVNLLERVGDYAESIARQVLLLSSHNYEIPAETFNEIANLAIPMLHNAVQAFVDRNTDLARSTMACEPRVN